MKDSLIGERGPSAAGVSARHWGMAIAAATIGASAAVTTAHAATAASQSTTMTLIRMMHDNGSITDAQYDQLQSAAAAEHRTPTAGRSNDQLADTNADSDAGVPTSVDNDFRRQVNERFDRLAWLDRIKLTGDLRLRYEYNDNSTREDADGHNIDRHRGRVRYRLGVITNPIDHLDVGAGIASGGDDPRSTNQTFGDDFSSKPIRLDYAYADYAFNDHISGIAGKFKFGDYLWQPTDLIWDGDINPEGASLHLQGDNALGTSFANGGVWVLQEFSDNASDPYLYYVQAGQHFKADKVFASLAGTYYGYENTAEAGTFNPDYSAGTNTTDQFSVVDINGQLGTRFSSGKAALIGEYVKNVHSGVDDDAGYALGTKVGWDRWAMKYLYGDLDANAVPDTFPDSDRLGGATAMKGHEVAVTYALNTAVEFGLDYYNTQSKRTTEDEQLLQADVVLSF